MTNALVVSGLPVGAAFRNGVGRSGVVLRHGESGTLVRYRGTPRTFTAGDQVVTLPRVEEVVISSESPVEQEPAQ